MIHTLQLYRGTGYDPYENLAVEQALCETVEAGTCILYLWQNQNTVVIGRNQNAWKECKIDLLAAEGGKLARRLSGGGAVYHDLGNLNFTFLLPSEEYDAGRQFAVIQNACASCGIETELSGRNDLLADGRKFSGSAFYHHDGRSYHHGTLLVHADTERMGRYLQPSVAKLQGKGVDSVRARVVNLCDLQPDLSVKALSEALEAAFGEVYHGLPEGIALNDRQKELTVQYTIRNRSWEWNCGQRMPFQATFQKRFPWGGIEISFAIQNGVIQQMQVNTDAMEHTLSDQVQRCLIGLQFDSKTLANAVQNADLPHAGDIASLFM
ncbi:MAG: lipoate--protein ligase [Clostridia bacterium]|nr:lipoate--protein ligase [Clostridia bacterium]